MAENAAANRKYRRCITGGNEKSALLDQEVSKVAVIGTSPPDKGKNELVEAEFQREREACRHEDTPHMRPMTRATRTTAITMTGAPTLEIRIITWSIAAFCPADPLMACITAASSSYIVTLQFTS
ncbi:hypothetical protein B5K06_27515 [Rhizobium grahamii]|uniref:Uncharacterized protein n=1 Tax=Rhizobium grahamii TaxID=1120045 RepID=A0A370KGX8_9HYPH|nr:hypothetical protein B5K06_27515 [Rhizobium grahamii]